MKKRKFSPGMCVVYLILIFWALTTIYPILWVILNSFKDRKKIIANSFALPIGDLFSMENYKTAFDRLNICGGRGEENKVSSNKVILQGLL